MCIVQKGIGGKCQIRVANAGACLSTSFLKVLGSSGGRHFPDVAQVIVASFSAGEMAE